MENSIVDAWRQPLNAKRAIFGVRLMELMAYCGVRVISMADAVAIMTGAKVGERVAGAPKSVSAAAAPISAS